MLIFFQDILMGDDYIEEGETCVTDENGYTHIMKAALCNSTQALKILLAQEAAPINAQHGKVRLSRRKRLFTFANS